MKIIIIIIIVIILLLIKSREHFVDTSFDNINLDLESCGYKGGGKINIDVNSFVNNLSKNALKYDLSYYIIKCLSFKYLPNNLITKIIEQPFVNIGLNNNFIVDSYLYKFADSGIIKYKIGTNNNTMLNGVFEVDLFNMLNINNMSNDSIMFINNNIIQKKEGERFYNILNREYYKPEISYNYLSINDIKIDLQKVIQNKTYEYMTEVNGYIEIGKKENRDTNINIKITEEKPEFSFNDIVSIINYNNDEYVITKNKVYPKSNWTLNLNNLLRVNNLEIIDIIPHVSYDKIINFKLIFILNNSKMIIVDKGNISTIRNVKELGFNIN